MRFADALKLCVIARPIWLLQMPLLRRSSDETFESASQFDREATHIVAEAPFAHGLHRRFNNREVTGPTFEVHRARNERCAGSQRKRCWAGRDRCCLAKEFEFDAVADNVAIGKQTHNVIRLQCLQNFATSIGTKRDDVHSEFSSEVDKEVKQRRRFKGFDNDGHRYLHHLREPKACPFPTAKVRKNKDHAVSGSKTIRDVSEVIDRKTKIDLFWRQLRKSKRIDPVPRVTVERCIDRTVECFPFKRGIGTMQVASDQHASFFRNRRSDAAQPFRCEFCKRSRNRPRECCARAVGRGNRIKRHTRLAASTRLKVLTPLR